MHRLAVLPGGGDARVFRWPVARYPDVLITWYREGADQALIARPQQDDAVQHDRGVAVVGELLGAEGLRPAAWCAERAGRDPIVDAIAAAQWPVRGAGAARTTAPAEREHQHGYRC